MRNFQPLKDADVDNIWEQFYDKFQFSPSTSDFPGIKISELKIRLDVSRCYGNDLLIHKLEDIALDLFLHISEPGERLYALDWQHECYDFDPRKPMERNEFGEWQIPVFPNGDYYIFLDKDLKNVWFGHPWEQTITIAGSKMIQRWNKIRLNFPEFPGSTS